MAGVGLLLRRLDPHRSFAGWGRVHGTAAVISSGPWLISILGILLVGLMALERVDQAEDIAKYQVSVTYLFAGSLVATGGLQFLLSRFVADRLFENRPEAVTPSIMGALVLTTAVSALGGCVVMSISFEGVSAIYRFLMVAGFVVMSNIWILIVIITSLKAHRSIVTVFLVAYAAILGASWVLGDGGVEGLLAAFVGGQGIIFFLLLGVFLREFKSDRVVAFDFLQREWVFPELAWAGLFYSLAVWVDKAVFWFHPSTGATVMGPLRASVVYDTPIFMAYLTIVPGMAVFLVRVETDFAERYDEFYGEVREGGTLREIEESYRRMLSALRLGFYDLVKVQALTLVVAFVVAPRAMDALGVSRHYMALFCVDSAGVAAQVLFLSVMNVLFYFDKRREALFLCVGFAVLNLLLTSVTLRLGPLWYGYGFTISGVVMVVVGLYVLTRCLRHLVRETFMFRSVSA